MVTCELTLRSTAKLFTLICFLDESLWQGLLTKETKEFKDSTVSTDISTVKDGMVNEQGKQYKLFFK